MPAISLSSYTNKLSIVTLVLMYLNVISLCTYSLSCANYYPTISFLATFRVHDLIVLLSLTIFAFSLIPVFVAVHVKTARVLTLDDSVFLMVLELAIVILTITVGIIDESNGIEFNLIDNLHVFLSFCLSCVSVLYVYSVLGYLDQSKLNAYESGCLQKCRVLFWVGSFLLVFTMIQWHFAHTVFNNWLFNTYLETLSEWTLVSLTMRFPVYLSGVLGYSITFIQQDKLD